VPPRAEVTFGCSPAYALEGMRPLLNMRTARAAWRSQAARGIAHVGSAAAWQVGGTGRATMLFKPVADAVAHIRAIAKRATALK